MSLGLQRARAVVLGSASGRGPAVAGHRAGEDAQFVVSGRDRAVSAARATAATTVGPPSGGPTPRWLTSRRRSPRRRSAPEEGRAAAHQRAIPLGWLGTSAQSDHVVACLCSVRATFVTGSVIRVDGGADRGL